MKEFDSVLLLADISGYTRFMMANRKSVAHATLIIKHLMDAMTAELVEPLKLVEIEGDALFCVAARPPATTPWEAMETNIADLTPRLFTTFIHTRNSLAANNPCDCEACKTLNQLELKLIVHSGRVAQYESANITKYSGADIIIAHRLLKNNVPSKRYALFTRDVFDALRLEERLKTQAAVEETEDVGTLDVRIYYPEGGEPKVRFNPFKRMAIGFWLMFGTLRLMLSGKLTQPST